MNVSSFQGASNPRQALITKLKNREPNSRIPGGDESLQAFSRRLDEYEGSTVGDMVSHAEDIYTSESAKADSLGNWAAGVAGGGLVGMIGAVAVASFMTGGVAGIVAGGGLLSAFLGFNIGSEIGGAASHSEKRAELAANDVKAMKAWSSN